ncbi:uncharacterized protein [Halyomorpha halys]|uniref:uncharacterized protein n=1 Tax=Halyomorpha halys TaxID=286706 RepID=UPI0006D516B8|nr:calcium-binding protein P [Halyomorpha halys]
MFFKTLCLAALLALAACELNAEYQQTENDQNTYETYAQQYGYNQGLNPAQFQGPYAYQGYPYQYQGQYPYQYKGQYPFQYQGQYPYQYQGQYPYQYQGQYPYQYQGQYPYQYQGQYPYQYQGQYPYQYQRPYVYPFQGQNYQNQVPFSGFPYNYYQVAAH